MVIVVQVDGLLKDVSFVSGMCLTTKQYTANSNALPSCATFFLMLALLDIIKLSVVLMMLDVCE